MHPYVCPVTTASKELHFCGGMLDTTRQSAVSESADNAATATAKSVDVYGMARPSQTNNWLMLLTEMKCMAMLVNLCDRCCVNGISPVLMLQRLVF